MAKIIQHNFFYPHPPEVVWDYLTKPELMAQWLMASNFEPIAGHEFQMKAGPMPSLNFDGNFYCKVLEVSPFETLSYSWKFGPGDGTLTDSVVIWTLSEKENGTELLLIHRGFKGENFMAMFDSMNEGWAKHPQKILKLIEEATNGKTKP